MSKIFIDTNILIYSIDSSEKRKLKRSRELLKSLIKSRTGVISTQVMQEFYVTCVKKLKIEPKSAKKMLGTLGVFEVVDVVSKTIEEAVDISILNEVSFWDSLIIAAAVNANCEELWTEDLNSGQKINGVAILNPLKT